MTILQIFNKYQFAGGEEASVLRVADTLEKNHKVVRCYFDSSEWVNDPRSFARIRQAFEMFYNPVAIRRVMERIEEEKPDLILVHNIFPICSLGMLWKIVHLPIPVVQYIHNFRPFSVNGYSWGDGRILPEGLDLNFLPEILAASWQSSRLKTAWYALVILGLHFTGCYKRMTGWLAISEFMKEKFVAGGVDPEKITVLRHSWNALSEEAYSAKREYWDGIKHDSVRKFLFLGRISEEKGLPTLVDAWKGVSSDFPDAELLVCGAGPLENWLREEACEIRGLRFLGSVAGEEKEKLLAECVAVVVPSAWWEPLGLVVYEAYDNGKPVIAAASGGLKETVLDGTTGLLHQPGDVGGLADCMRRLLGDPRRADEMGQNGRDFLLRGTNPKDWEKAINVAFEQALSRKSAERENDHLSDISHPPHEALEPDKPKLNISCYLADQNPGYDRSFGISRMSRMVLGSLQGRGNVNIEAVVSQSSQRGPGSVTITRSLPWGTRSKLVRLLTDHLHPLFIRPDSEPDVYYFPKGYLPLLDVFCRPSVVTIHDTIIQYDEDHYPEWRAPWEYGYWAGVLKHTLRNANRIMTVSEFSKRQIRAFMLRHGIPEKEITVTYEPCAYESVPQPDSPEKGNKVIHLASIEPHKRTAQLILWWLEAEADGRDLPELELIGSVADGLLDRIETSRTIRLLPFMEDAALQAAYSSARALVLPSEIEGFGLPALEAYYLGTPVCFVKDTSVEEILAGATSKGSFSLESRESFFAALDEVMAMEPSEIRRCGLMLRETFDSAKVAERIEKVFQCVKDDPRVTDPQVESALLT